MFVIEYVIPFLFVLTVLVFVHELGHFWVARRAGVRVEVFSIGFGPELFGFNDRHGTRWKLSAVPLGGYVKMLGQDADPDSEEEIPEEDLKFSFHFKSLGWRSAIVAAGPIANFLLAIVLFAGLYVIVGVPRPLPVVGQVQSESPAESAGLRAGDRIVAIDGNAIEWFDDLRRVVAESADAVLNMRVARDGDETMIAVHIASVERDGRRIGSLGVVADGSAVAYERRNPLSATVSAIEMSAGVTWKILTYVGQVIVGARPAEEIGGPIRIAQMSGEVAAGGFANLIFFMAVLSVNLGLINLFPVPMLDGGHLVFFALEAARGRPLGAKAQEYGFRFGLILVFLLMVFATWNDLVQLKVFELIKQFIT